MDLAALRCAIRRICERRDRDHHRFSACNRWLDGSNTRSTVNRLLGANVSQGGRSRPFVVESDLPAAFGGGNRAMDPLEHLLAAMVSCLTTTLVLQASLRGIHLDAVEAQADGDIDLAACFGIDANARAGFRSIRIVVVLESETADSALDELLEVAANVSPVLDNVRHGCRVRIERVESTLIEP